MWFIYILECRDGAFYVGETGNVPARLSKHIDGSASTFTAARRPVKLVHVERHADRRSALARERQLKGWTRAKKKALTAGNIVTQ